MEPSWSEIKRILRRLEDIVEGIRVQFNEISTKLNNLEQMVNALLQPIDSLELERQRTSALEQTIAVLLQRMDSLKQECNQLRAMVMPQQSNSNSNNQNTVIP